MNRLDRWIGVDAGMNGFCIGVTWAGTGALRTGGAMSVISDILPVSSTFEAPSVNINVTVFLTRADYTLQVWNLMFYLFTGTTSLVMLILQSLKPYLVLHCMKHTIHIFN